MLGSHDVCIKVQRYDRLESRYLTTGDFSALQQMNTDYPIETRTLIEKVLQLGVIEDFEIHKKFLRYYQDSTLQMLIGDAEAEYANMSDINKKFCKVFHQLKEWLPGLPKPQVYAQIGSLDQSIIIGEEMIGISLDKYMGEDYRLYKKYYSAEQLKSMKREYIVPDALSFYLLSLYPLQQYDLRSQKERDLHMAKMMWILNKAMGKDFFKTKFIDVIDKYMRRHPEIEIGDFIKSNDYHALLP